MSRGRHAESVGHLSGRLLLDGEATISAAGCGPPSRSFGCLWVGTGKRVQPRKGATVSAPTQSRDRVAELRRLGLLGWERAQVLATAQQTPMRSAASDSAKYGGRELSPIGKYAEKEPVTQ